MSTESSLKMVFAIRHGDYSGSTMELDGYGRAQSEFISKKIRTMIPNNFKVIVITSPLQRAMGTAEIIATNLNASVRVCGHLQDDNYDTGNIKRREIISLAMGVDVVVAISHSVSPSGIINAFSKQAFQEEVHCFECRKGNGLMVDLTTRRIITDLLNKT